MVICMDLWVVDGGLIQLTYGMDQSQHANNRSWTKLKIKMKILFYK